VLGVKRFKQLANASSVPVVALGGITSDNRQQLTDYGVAVITTLLASHEPEKVALSLSQPKVTK